ncbi:MAG: nucleotidyltransferase family protein [Phycisphaerae bacterium]|nr:nucleotidyltransferase family protein [Phycisphaerae bacterium]
MVTCYHFTKRTHLWAENSHSPSAFSVKQLGLFGSAVRGELTADSDIDILVDLAEPTFEHYMDLKFYLQEIFKTEVDLVMKDIIKLRMESAISKEVVYAKGI